MTKQGKNKIYLYYEILTKWNYDKNYIREKMKEYLTKEEYHYFIKRIMS